MTWTQICARRLARHGLIEPVAAERLADQVGVICGAHAQIMSAAEVSIGQRVAGVTRQDVREALWSTHRLIKTFGPRGTVHLLPADDLPKWAGALATLPVLEGLSPRDRYLTPEQVDLIVGAVGEALAEAELTVDELDEVVVKAVGAWAGERVLPAFNGYWARWRQALDAAAHRGVLCYGPERGRKATFTNPRRWLPKFRPAKSRTAVTWLVRRYLHAYGPATAQQFAQWLSAPNRWAADLFDRLAGELVAVEVEGAPAYLPAGEAASDDERDAPRGLRLLPYFDAYVVGCHPREKVYPGRAAERALARGQAGNFPVLLIDGVVAGIWQQKRSGKKIAITVEAFRPLSKRQQGELEAQAARLGEIQEGRLELALGPVTTGAHA